MSHDATNWAIKQRGIKPALKVVLWNLCDRYHPDNGCFPSQETLAEDCEVPRSTLNTYLSELEGLGLILREQRRDKGSKRQQRTRYYFPFEPDFAAKKAEKPSPETGHGSDEAESGFEGEPSPENGESRVQNLDSNPVREPVREPVNERGRVREPAEDRENDLKALEARHDALRIGKNGNPWPAVLDQSKDWSFRQFVALSPEDRAAAEERRDAYLALCPKIKSGDRKGQPNAVPLGVYLRDKLFRDVEKIAPRIVERADAKAAARLDKVAAAPFGPLFGAVRAWLCLQGPDDTDVPLDVRDAVIRHYEGIKRNPHLVAGFLRRKGLELSEAGDLIFPPGFDADERRHRLAETGYPAVNKLHEQARLHQPAAVAASFQALKTLCEPVPVDGPVFAAWLAHDEREAWPKLPDPGRMDVVWLPKGGPQGLGAFEAAARAILDEAEARGDEHAA